MSGRKKNSREECNCRVVIQANERVAAAIYKRSHAGKN